ncbi:MAG: Wzz/FepE/Etk N-terminal domain-containing protein [Lachnospiraceae bacterium]|nr:Wzz/FepE/Etk N-terminal domain-containing protein [Lachnospiraceae bacterium]
MRNRQLRDGEIDLKLIFLILARKLWLILLVSVVFMVAAVTYSKLLVVPTYKSSTQMFVLAKQNQEINASDLQVSTYLTQDYVQIIKSRTVAETVIEQLGLDTTYEKLLRQVSVSTVPETRIISISVIDADPEQARSIADTIREVASGQIMAVMDIETVNVVDMANLPQKKFAPYIAKNGVVAGMAGFVLSALLIVLMAVLNDRIKTVEDVERYLDLNVLGSVPVPERKMRKSGMFRKKR